MHSTKFLRLKRVPCSKNNKYKLFSLYDKLSINNDKAREIYKMIQCKEFIEKNAYKVQFHKDTLLTNPLEKDRDLYFFISKEVEVKNPKLDLSTIKGASYTHGHKVAKTWSDMIKLLRRYNQYVEIDCERNGGTYPSVEYYFGDKYKNDDPWGIQFIDGVGYILEGHNRTTIAKYLAALDKIPNQIAGFEYARYTEIDMLKYKQYERVKKFVDSLPMLIRDNITFKIFSKTIEVHKTELEVQTKKHTIFSIRVGIGYLYNGNEVPITTDLNTISEFRKEIFKQLRLLKLKFKYRLLIDNIVYKFNFINRFQNVSKYDEY